MRRLLLLLALLGAATAALAWNAEAILLYHFDETRISPSEAGESRLREIERDGIILWVASPRPGKATVLYFHGNAGNLANRSGRFTAFLDRGLGVVAMAYPGSSGSTGEQTADWFSRVAVSVYLDTPELIGNGPVVLYGESLGTGIAVYVSASAASDSVKGIGPPAAMVLEAPYTSIRDATRHHYPQLGDLVERLPNLLPSKDWITAPDVPLLILHGSEDRVIPVEMGQELFDLASTTDKTLHIVQGAGHANVWQPSAQRALYDFLDRF